MEIDHHVGVAMSGLVADAITLIDNARVNAANHQFNYGEPMSVRVFYSPFTYRQRVLHSPYPRSCFPSVKMMIQRW